MNNKSDKSNFDLEVIRITKVNPLEWDECVLSSSLGYVYSLYDYVSVCEYDNAINLSFAIRDNTDKSILLVMPLFYYPCGEVNSSHKELKSRYGPVIRDLISAKKKEQAKRILSNELNAQLISFNQKELIVQLAAFCNQNLKTRVNPLIFWGFEPRVRYTWICNLTVDEKELFKDLSGTTRNQLRKLLKNENYYIRESTSESSSYDYSTFWELSNATYTRNGLIPKSKAYYQNQFNLIKNNTCRVFFLYDKHNNLPISSAMVHIYKNTARITWKVSLCDRPSHTDELLIYRIIQMLKDSDIVYLEIGGAYPYLETSDKRRRISDFKRNFTKELYPIMMGFYRI